MIAPVQLRSVVVVAVAVGAIALLAILSAFAVEFRTNKKAAPPLTVAKKKENRLAERDRIATQVRSLQAEGKLPEAIAAARAMLAIECEVLRDDHEEVAGSLEWLAELHLARRDWPAAR